MTDKIKKDRTALGSVLTVLLVLGTLFAFAIAHLLLPDGEISFAERRKLQQIPVLSGKTILSGEFMVDLETYMLDQFPLRDSVKAKLEWPGADIFACPRIV